jgi:hypothetical protein
MTTLPSKRPSYIYKKFSSGHTTQFFILKVAFLFDQHINNIEIKNISKEKLVSLHKKKQQKTIIHYAAEK